jgi:hypothetical protein
VFPTSKVSATSRSPVGTAWRLSETFRIGLGVDLQTPTGRAELSDNNWRLQEFGAIGWDITSWLTFSPSFEYNQSLAEEGATAPSHFLEAFFPFTFHPAAQVGHHSRLREQDGLRERQLRHSPGQDSGGEGAREHPVKLRALGQTRL